MYSSKAGGRIIDTIQLTGASQCRFASRDASINVDALAPGVTARSGVPTNALCLTVMRAPQGTATRSYYLVAASVDDQQRWIAALSEVIKDLAKRSPAPAAAQAQEQLIRTASTSGLKRSESTSSEPLPGVIRSGEMTKLGFESGKWQRRAFVLSIDGTLGYASGADKKAKKLIVLGPKSRVDLVPAGSPLADDALAAGVRPASALPPYTLCLRAYTQRGDARTYYLVTDSAAEMLNWRDAFNKILQDESRTVPVNRQNWREDRSVAGCMSW
jgi:hypothetical protein